MKIGIVIAIERELKAFLNSNYEVEECVDNKINYFKAKIGNNEVYAIRSGAGLVDAAMSTEYLISKHDVKIILNFGVVGALDPSLKVSDLFYVSKCLNYDFDTSNIDPIAKCQYYDMDDVFIPLDKHLIELAKDIEPNLIEAIAASGDKFVIDKTEKEDRFALGCNICDMEIVAIARVCYLNDVKCLSIKCISDTYDGDGSDFEKNVTASADKAFRIIDKLIKEL